MPLAVVTGSSSGIGRATALEFARRGYDLVLHAGRNLAGLQQTAAQIIASTSGQSDLLTVVGDISRPTCCSQLVAAAFGWRGAVDAWVNAAGADVLTGSLAAASFECKLEQLWRVDVEGTIQLSRAVVKRMRLQPDGELPHPSLINIGWDQAWSGIEDDAGQLFCTTKAAVEAFTRALALSAGPKVRVNLVAPGWIQTKWGNSTSAYWQKRAQNESILARWGQPQDVARAIAWLTSQEAEFVNGQSLSVNGGLAARKHTLERS